tara:strand:+ start:736 stop:837 length:102 start_codon:yes stop_codon:yes gene_type:complete
MLEERQEPTLVREVVDALQDVLVLLVVLEVQAS